MLLLQWVVVQSALMAHDPPAPAWAQVPAVQMFVVQSLLLPHGEPAREILQMKVVLSQLPV